MNHKFSRQQILVIFLLAILFGGATLMSLGNADRPINPIFIKLRYVLVGISLISILSIKKFGRKSDDKWHFNKQAAPLLWLWFSFCLMQITSGFVNDDLVSVRDGYWFMIGVPIVFFNVLPKLMKESADIIIALSLVIGHIPYMLTSLWLHPLHSYQENLYRGVFGNSNQMGAANVVIAAGLFILLTGALLAKKPAYYIWTLVLLLIGSFSLIYLAFARTSMITFSLVSLVSGLIVFYKYPKALYKLLFFAAFIVSLLIYELEKIALFTRSKGINVLDIVQKKEISLSGRDEIWITTYNQATWFGHGFTYHKDVFNLGAHNSIIKILGSNGVVAALFILSFAIASFIYSYFYFKNNFKDNYYAITPFVITLCFWTISIGENMLGSLGKGITLAYFASMGVVMNQPDKKIS